jgi:hypothetical protein
MRGADFWHSPDAQLNSPNVFAGLRYFIMTFTSLALIRRHQVRHELLHICTDVEVLDLSPLLAAVAALR